MGAFVLRIALTMVAFVASDGPGNKSGSTLAAASAGSLYDLPNATVRYYEVSGRDVASINKSIATQRPKVAGKIHAASTSWTVSTNFQTQSVDGVCRITDAKVVFAAEAELPKLVDEEKIQPRLLVQWRRYVEGLEANELPTLMFVYSQLGAVQDAVAGSSCEDAKAAGERAVSRLKSQATAFDLARQKQLRRTEQRFTESGWFDTPQAKPICKNLVVTGSRLQSFRVCMVAREWELLQKSGEKATRELQDRPLLNRTPI